MSRLLELIDVGKDYRTAEGRSRQVLGAISLRLDEGEIVAILGKSGCGKSSLLRIIAGLVPASAGEVLYRGAPVRAPAAGIAMVFQSFALFPWLTVLQNVELGLEAQGVGPEERRQRAVAAIDLIGLDGYESAYPKELSGGMRQRVGFARALVIRPDLLLLDEPFSALDVLTAETLRGDLLELWEEKRIPTRGIIFVSHSIEEAVEMADRIVVLASDPGRVRSELPIGLQRPRNAESAAFRRLVDQVYTLLTEPAPERVAKEGAVKRKARGEGIGVGYRLPSASIQQLTGLLDALASPPFNGHADLPQLADETGLNANRMLPLLETLQLLGFARVGHGDIELTDAGRLFSEADILGRKQLFAQHLLRHVPLTAHIRRILGERETHQAPRERFLSELEDFLSENESRRVLRTVINWSRYAELFAYDDHSGVLSLENP